MREEEWVDDSPVVRPYALTGGRTRPGSEAFDLLALVGLTGEPVPRDGRLGHEHLRLLRLVGESRPVVEIVSDSGLPLGVVRVLLSDLLTYGLILVRPPRPGGSGAYEGLLREVLRGLQAL